MPNSLKCKIKHLRHNGTITESESNRLLKALEHEPSRDMEEVKEIMGCDVDIETKYKMISNILTAKPHYFKKQESVLDKIRAEIEALPKTYPFINHIDTYVKEDDVKKIIDKYKAEKEAE